MKPFKSTDPVPKSAVVDTTSRLPDAGGNRMIAVGGYQGVLALAFGKPLLAAFGLALTEPLHSHLLLIPLISGYLLYVDNKRLPKEYGTSWLGALLLACAGGVALLFNQGGINGAAPSGQTSGLAVQIFAWVCFVNAGGYAFLGPGWMRAAAFPMAFLLFTIPLPDPAVHWMEHQLKVASGEAAALLFDLVGLPYLRDGLFFKLPGILIEVADECSGIRSSYVLFITSTVAAYMFLNSPWRRSALALAVIPLGILRNGFRILVIALLCVEVGPEMIHSYIHHKGGPIFFALSLVPLFALLWWLRRGDVGRVASRRAKVVEKERAGAGG